jgi:hypothetical protein
MLNNKLSSHVDMIRFLVMPLVCSHPQWMKEAAKTFKASPALLKFTKHTSHLSRSFDHAFLASLRTEYPKSDRDASLAPARSTPNPL